MPAAFRPVSVAVHAASLEYDGAPLFDALDFTLAGGRWTCVLGPSGVGKTTLLRLIAGLAPIGGDTRIICDDGFPLAGRVAWMGQQDLLFPWLSVLDNVLLGARLRGELRVGDATGARAHELLRLVGLDDRARARPDALSGGQRQRAALARTLMENRPVILMDEPFSGLDSITRWRLQELASELLRGRTVLLVTHDPREALRLGHYVHVMAGRPARLDLPLTLDGETPRRLDDADLLWRESELIGRLANAAAIMEPAQ
ncbi:MAG TPA: ABC transporter ATP-binding protein [Alphaproteobacteria bacterium]|nr:ABC transporter ATP-binding protein [Alphaproteobacteria bacterium]